MNKINISGLSKAKVLAALYNNSFVQGMGIFQARAGGMTEEQAEKIIKETPDMYFDYVYGKVIKVDLSKDDFDPRLYDRDNGQGSASRIIESLRNNS